jgi:hypothetical protein
MLLGDYVRILCFLALLHGMHIAAFGWPLGFPLPNAVFLFFPFIGGALLAIGALLGTLVFLALVLKPRWLNIK